LARHPADGSQNDKIGADTAPLLAEANTAPLLAEIEALKQRLAALEARLPRSAVADPPERRQAIRQPRPRGKTDAAELEPDAATRLARRRALGLGALAPLFGLTSRSASAADALTIDPNGVNIDNLSVQKSLAVAGPVKIDGKNALEFGADIPKEVDAGQIAYQKHSGNALDIVGAGAAARERRISMWAEGGATLNGSLTVTDDATLKKSLIVSSADGAKRLHVSPTAAGANTLDVQSAFREGGSHPTGLALYVTAPSRGDSGGIEFRHSNASQGIGFGYNTIYATGSDGDQDLFLKARGTGSVRIVGNLQANAVTDANPLRNRMYPADPVVYQDIFDALTAGAIQKLGNPPYDDTRYKGQSLWGDRHIIKFGGNNDADGNGAVVTIPGGYDTVWVRVLGERWNVIHAYLGLADRGLWTGGFRSANSYAPDGTLADGNAVGHQWVPIPARSAGRLALISKPNTDKDFWVSGLAFSNNPWGHAVQSAIGYHWAVNGGEATGWQRDGHNFNSDTLATIPPKTTLVLKVPVVPSGRDKLLYLIEHNSNWNGSMHTAITVEGKPLERFMASYDNPFSRHWNSKSFERYIAARIPNELIPSNASFLNVIIDMTKQDKEINFREIGTHDLVVPRP
jgi:hypothetical protein